MLSGAPGIKDLTARWHIWSLVLRTENTSLHESTGWEVDSLDHHASREKAIGSYHDVMIYGNCTVGIVVLSTLPFPHSVGCSVLCM